MTSKKLHFHPAQNLDDGGGGGRDDWMAILCLAAKADDYKLQIITNYYTLQKFTW